MAGLCAPLPTLRLRPRERKRTAWGRCGSLLLHRIGLAPITPCRSPGAQSPQLDQEVRREPPCVPGTLKERTHERVPLDWAASFGSQAVAMMQIADTAFSAGRATASNWQGPNGVPEARL